jgi:hypothetical protein
MHAIVAVVEIDGTIEPDASEALKIPGEQR